MFLELGLVAGLMTATPEAAMLLGKEPEIEVEDVSICPSRWHVQSDWYTYCSYTLPGFRTAFLPGCDIKVQPCQLPPATRELLGWPVEKASWPLPVWRGDRGVGVATGNGGGWGSDTTVIVVSECCGGCIVCPYSPEPEPEPEPSPVPNPASGWLLGLSLMLLRWRKG